MVDLSFSGSVKCLCLCPVTRLHPFVLSDPVPQFGRSRFGLVFISPIVLSERLLKCSSSVCIKQARLRQAVTQWNAGHEMYKIGAEGRRVRTHAHTLSCDCFYVVFVL